DDAPAFALANHPDSGFAREDECSIENNPHHALPLVEGDAFGPFSDTGGDVVDQNVEVAELTIEEHVRGQDLIGYSVVTGKGNGSASERFNFARGRFGSWPVAVGHKNIGSGLRQLEGDRVSVAAVRAAA